MRRLSWIFDLDGVVTANPAAISWLTWHLKKNENCNEVYILTWRHNNAERFQETWNDLERFGIVFDKLIMAPEKFKNAKEAGFWKINEVKKLKADIWFDDEIKSYQRDYGMNLEKLLPDVAKVWI